MLVIRLAFAAMKMIFSPFGLMLGDLKERLGFIGHVDPSETILTAYFDGITFIGYGDSYQDQIAI
jgi:hypothetical protein